VAHIVADAKSRGIGKNFGIFRSKTLLLSHSLSCHAEYFSTDARDQPERMTTGAPPHSTAS
jgi:hypothetical protein